MELSLPAFTFAGSGGYWSRKYVILKPSELPANTSKVMAE
jgi:hypothetical protein